MPGVNSPSFVHMYKRSQVQFLSSFWSTYSPPLRSLVSNALNICAWSFQNFSDMIARPACDLQGARALHLGILMCPLTYTKHIRWAV